MINLQDYGFTPDFIPENANGIRARVTAVHKERYELVSECGECSGRLKSSVYFNGGGEKFPTAGDFVLIEYNQNGDSRIIATLKRKTLFSRRDPSPPHYEQAVAANFDYVFITQSLNQNFSLKRLERYLTLAWQSGAVPAVILTKADLAEDYTSMLNAAEKTAAGTGVYAVSAVTGFGLDQLDGYLKPGKTVVFLGSSGVGKSSLINALARGEIMQTSAIREDDARGRHTTTHRQLIKLQSGVMVIDTPGMRELGMWDVTEGLGEAFGDVEVFLGKCKFTDCRHQNEPGCAVKAAIENGTLSRERWNSYNALKKEAMFSDDKEGYLQQKWKRNKEISKFSKQINKQRSKRNV